ncbi:hypothetical protein [Flavobacterium sp.]|jgi:hypothetical protein|uniref:hypothetical protein n=1 Tax=Flavobacterium sp. TaxID=239 RepID=UPI0037C0F6F5
MDLGKLDLTKAANEGAWITLKHPATGEDLSARIKIVGKDSTKFLQLSEEYRRKTLEDMKSNKTMSQKMEAAQEQSDAILVACTLDWDGMMLDGQDLVFNESNVKMVYQRFSWIKEQVDVAIADRANFLIP